MRVICTAKEKNGGGGCRGENRVGGRAVLMGVTREGSPEEVTWWLIAEGKQGSQGGATSLSKDPRARKSLVHLRNERNMG